MLLSEHEVFRLTDLEGVRRVNHQLRKKLLLKLAKRHFPPGSQIADIGCAAGDLSIELQALGFQVTGIDFEPERLSRARAAAAKVGLAVRFIQEDLRGIQLERQFDGMVMGEILEHFSEPRRIVEDYLPHLRPGGKILITVPNVASLRARLKLLFLGLFADHNPQHLFYFTRRRFAEHFQALPLEIVEAFTFLYELTLIRSRAWARGERWLLQPLSWIMPDGGSHLVVVVRKRDERGGR